MDGELPNKFKKKNGRMVQDHIAGLNNNMNSGTMTSNNAPPSKSLI